MQKQTTIAHFLVAKRPHGIVAVATTSYANTELTPMEMEKLAAEIADLARHMRGQQRIAKGRSWD